MKKKGITTELTTTVKKVLNGVIISPLDRNNGQLFVMCPHHYREAFCATFGLHTNRKRVSFVSTLTTGVGLSVLRGIVAEAVTPPGRPPEDPPEGPAEQNFTRPGARPGVDLTRPGVKQHLRKSCIQATGVAFVEPHQAIKAFPKGNSCLRHRPPVTYKLLPLLEPSAVLSQWRQRFRGMQHLGLLRSGSMPYAYIIPKHKDVLRFRPIVSYADAPHRVMLRSTARGLMFIMGEVDCEQFTLWSAYRARAGLRAAHLDLMKSAFARQYSHWRVHCLSLDIKEMYTALPHAEIRRAVTWCCNLFRKQARRDRCNIAIHGRADGRRGRLYDAHQRREVSLQDITAMTDLTLQEAYFTAGDVTCLQRIGIPMGCPTSPALAIAVCIYGEHRYISSLQHVQRPVAGVRYFDDLLIWTLVRTTGDGTPLPGETKSAHQMLTKPIYHKSLRLIDQGEGPDLFQFLEATVNVKDPHTIKTRYRNRNSVPLLSNEPGQEIQRFRSGHSNAPRDSLRRVMQSMLSRATEFESSPLEWVASILLLIQEFNLLNYPLGMIRRSLSNLSRHHPLGKAWTCIQEIIQDNVK